MSQFYEMAQLRAESAPLGIAVALETVIVWAGAIAAVTLLGAIGALLTRLLALVAA